MEVNRHLCDPNSSFSITERLDRAIEKLDKIIDNLTLLNEGNIYNDNSLKNLYNDNEVKERR